MPARPTVENLHIEKATNEGTKVRNRDKITRLGIATMLFASASAFGLQAASAQSGNPCGAVASNPEFDQTEISGDYDAVCGSNPKADIMYGKIMEDRFGLPDVQHDVENFAYVGTEGSTVSTNTCQDGDDIYIEAYNDDDSDQSSRRNMSC
jgi:hypothetical protein